MTSFSSLSRWAALLCVTLFLTGCAAPTQRLSDADRNLAKTAQISQTVQKAPDAFLLAPSAANIGMMFGAVGGLATAGAQQTHGDAFREFLAKNSISIEKIAREEMERVLRESGKVSIVAPGSPTAPTIKINVQQYGFGVVHLVSSKVVPVLMIKCDMVDSSGRTIWSASDRMLPSVASPMESTTWEELRDNPKRIEEEWRKASRFLAKAIVQQL